MTADHVKGDDLGLTGVPLAKLVEDREHVGVVVRAARWGDDILCSFDARPPLAAAALLGHAMAPIVDDELPNELGRQGEELVLVDHRFALVEHTDDRVVGNGGWLERERLDGLMESLSHFRRADASNAAVKPLDQIRDFAA